METTGNVDSGVATKFNEENDFTVDADGDFDCDVGTNLDIDSVNIIDSKDGEETVVNRATDSITGVSDSADANVCDSICDVDDTSAADDDVDKKVDSEVYVADVAELEAADGID